MASQVRDAKQFAKLAPIVDNMDQGSYQRMHLVVASSSWIEELMTPRVGIIGLGHVGQSMYDLFSQHTKVVTFDIIDHEDYPATDLEKCDFGVVCVDTPEMQDGACDISKVSEAINRIPIDRILLKSTVPPGTTDRLILASRKQICFSPEYIGESSYYHPFWADGVKAVPFVILGGEFTIRRWFVDRLLPILGPTKTYFQCTALEAETIKYMANSYFATKISFVNEFRNICENLGADWHTVREGWLLDPRIEPSHSAVFTEAPGFGGKCLPKDLNAIVHASLKVGYEPKLLIEVLRSNRRFRSVEDTTELPR